MIWLVLAAVAGAGAVTLVAKAALSIGAAVLAPKWTGIRGHLLKALLWAILAYGCCVLVVQCAAEAVS